MATASASSSSSSSSSNRPRLAPLTPATPASTSGSEGISRIEGYHPSTYSSRMAGRSSFSSPASSSPASPLSRRGSCSSAEPVVRGGFVIPSITLTPPDARHSRSQSLPWQDFTSKTTLYVPVKTEDIGWEEGGLWWCGKFEYREVSLYGGKDDHVVGKYRGGPEGYSYMDIWDQDAFDGKEAAPPRKNDEPAPQKAASKKVTTAEKRRASESAIEERPAALSSTSSSSSSSSSGNDTPKSSASTTSVSSSSATSILSTQSSEAPAKATLALIPDNKGTITPPPSSRRSSASSCPSLSSTPSSSRRSSDSTNDDDDDAMDLDTPVDPSLPGSYSTLVTAALAKGEDAETLMCDSPSTTLDPSAGAKAPFAKLEAALLALKAEKKAHGGGPIAAIDEEPTTTSTKAAVVSPTSATPRPAPASIFKSGQSLLLSEDGPSASHHWPRGRGVARIAARPC
ncbi:hypothetical protein BCV69DRAFT_133761 [Microstroma glucosiphilum]|uniref:Uncharacterized protein n=1 Tax=Pseudomicrostroma glucosiphilum TaxID=1684307 RepID=A0A316UA76_9BASI|nr:hypothetical protein BCV69DRAFT_133761 [Pseudomicrostroma glucosiphilum]PWN22130.1 hypothetical protein BCV69DRAFT_133761 [Pseudomicrostroma glucosiphilum]